VCKRFRDYLATSLTLQSIIANRGCGGKRLLDITTVQQIARTLCMMRPDTGETIGLQLLHDGQTVGLALSSSLPLSIHLAGDTQNCLNMMTNFVCDHVCLRKIAGRTETSLQVAIE
jgi:hypothetical protein